MNVCMLAYTFYEMDNRVRRYAETLYRRGDKVCVVSCRQSNQEKYGYLNGVEIYRIQERILNEKGKFSYLYRLIKFLIKSSIFVAKKNLKNSFDLIHVHSVPDFEVLAGLIPKLFGTKIILDIHDIVPEFYISKFGGKRSSYLFKMLKIVEKYSCRIADHVIVSNHIWENKLIDRSAANEKVTTILNFPDNSIFISKYKKRNSSKKIIMYPGTINWHQGLDIAVKSFSKISSKFPETEFHIYGTGPGVRHLTDLIEGYGLQERVLLKGIVPMELIAEKMKQCDIGIIPKRNDSFGGEAFSTKSLEFMLMGVPLIMSRTKIDNYYFNDSVVKFFNPEDIQDLSICIEKMLSNGNDRKKQINAALKFVDSYKWDRNKDVYLKIVDSLVK